jgi:hypothetical protein
MFVKMQQAGVHPNTRTMNNLILVFAAKQNSVKATQFYWKVLAFKLRPDEFTWKFLRRCLTDRKVGELQAEWESSPQASQATDSKHSSLGATARPNLVTQSE